MTHKQTVLTLFAGGGLKSYGAKLAGCELVGAIEYDEAIAGCYAMNVSPFVTVAKVQDVDFRPYSDVDGLLMSPPCPSFSVAKSCGKETELDIAMADACCRAIREMRPKWMMLENVYGYRKSVSFGKIVDTLTELGYSFDYYHVNSADYGVPQTRMRLILRAVRSGYLPSLPRKVAKMTGWYEAVSDLIPTLPESQVAPWQLARMGDMSKRLSFVPHPNADCDRFLVRDETEPIFTVTPSLNGVRAFLCDDQNGSYKQDGSRALSTREVHEPAVTVGASPTHRPLRAFLVNHRNGGGVDGGPAKACVVDADQPAFTVDTGAFRRQSSIPSAFLCSGTDANTYEADDPAMTVTAAQGNGMIASRAFIAPVGGNESSVASRTGDEPAFTVMTNGVGRTKAFVPIPSEQPALFDVARVEPSLEWLNYVRVVSMTTRCLARFQSVPDCFELTGNNELDCTWIGNGCPVLLAQRIVEGLVAATGN
jgi:site-specific DNA-cytosine methylase